MYKNHKDEKITGWDRIMTNKEMLNTINECLDAFDDKEVVELTYEEDYGFLVSAEATIMSDTDILSRSRKYNLLQGIKKCKDVMTECGSIYLLYDDYANEKFFDLLETVILHNMLQCKAS